MQKYKLILKKRCAAHRNFKPTTVLADASRETGLFISYLLPLTSYLLEVYLLIHHLAVQDLEGIEFRFAVKEREDGIADSRIIG